MSGQGPGLGTLLIFLIGFLGIWVIVCVLIARFGGWAQAEKAFAAGLEPPEEGPRFGRRTLRIGRFTRYGNAMFVVISKKGVYLRPTWAFRIAHQPLHLPWRAVKAIEKEEYGLGATVTTSLIVEPPKGGPSMRFMLIGKDMRDTLAAHAPARLARNR